MKKRLFTSLLLFFVIVAAHAQQKTVLFDLSHSQCTDTYVGFETYPKVIPGYQEIVGELGARFEVNDSSEITPELLKQTDVLIMLSPLSNKLQKNLTNTEKKTLVDFVHNGGALLFFIDDEHRIDIDKYGANDIVRPFGIEFGPDVPVPGNVGAISFENEIFAGRREIPYSGARLMKGGIPVSVCMEEGYLHASYVELENGGKLYAAADTMVGLLLGYPDGVRKVSNKMQTRWWGKDSKRYMSELIAWALE